MLSILLLDDEPNLLSARSRTLRSQLDTAVRVETCSDPDEALARVGAHDFDVIVAGCDMALMNGVRFLHFARALQPEALRVLVGTPGEIGSSAAAIDELGGFRCAVEPWSDERLVDDVRAALAQAAASRAERELAAAVRAASSRVGGSDDAGRRIGEACRK
ncbi:MAG: response regulator [Pseudomonadota bacterium]